MSDAKEVKKPTLTDYLAGAVLANGFVWIWAMALGYLQNVFSADAAVILGLLSYLLFILGGSVASFLVCKRTSSKHLLVGLKLAALSWVFSIILMPASEAGFSISFLIALLLCFFIGGIVGAYLALKSSLRSPVRVEASQGSSGPSSQPGDSESL